MSLPGLAAASVEVLVAATVTDHGRILEDWDQTPTATVVSGCSFQPASGADDESNREGASLSGVLYAPPNTTITSRNRVRVDGRVFQVLGVPERWGALSLSHVRVNLSLWEG